MIERERAFDDLLDFLAREAVTEMDADRSSIFLLDEARRELWTRVALGLDGVIRIPADRGIVGHVTTTGELLNVADPYADTRFNPQVDRDTGYRTRSILCGPLRAPDGRIVGALQVLNKRGGGPFLAIDVKRFERVASRCALEIERAKKTIGSSLEAAPVVHVTDPELHAALDGVDLAEIAITSEITVSDQPAPAGAFVADEVAGVAVVPALATGTKCARSWRFTHDVGSDAAYPDVSARDAAALRELAALGRI